jgi:hypothetical protein
MLSRQAGRRARAVGAGAGEETAITPSIADSTRVTIGWNYWLARDALRPALCASKLVNITGGADAADVSLHPCDIG